MLSKVLVDVGSKLRYRLDNLPSRRAKELATAESPEEVTAILEEDNREFLEELQNLTLYSQNGDGSG